MGITYSAAPGTHITSPAMTEVLPNQSQQTGNNTVVVSDTLVNIGGGQIGSGANGVGDTYAGRLLIIDQNLSTEQIRKCITDTAGTGTTRILTVSEDWGVNPVITTNTVWVPYELADIEDGGAGNGINLSTKTGLWELSNVLTIDSTGNLAALDGLGLEMDDRGSSASFIVSSGGWFYVGYNQAGSPVGGIIMTSYNNTLAEPSMQVASGGHVRMFDTTIWGQLVAQQFECVNNSDAEFTNVKWLSMTDELLLADTKITNCSIAGRGAATEIVRFDGGSSVNGLNLSGVQEVDSAISTATETLTSEAMRFIDVPGKVVVRQNRTWNLIDPVWDVLVFSDLTWTGTTTGNELNDRRSIRATVKEADGTLLQDALVNIYENTVLDDLVLELVTDVDGFAGDSFIYKKHATNSVTTTYGGHARQAGKWLYSPAVFGQVATVKFNGDIILALDPNIVQTTQATAITAGSGVTWNEDTNPSELFEFTAGSGSLSGGMILTFSPSGAVGTINDLLVAGANAGTVHLRDRNATAIANGDTFTRTGGTAGSFSGTYTNDSKHPYSIWIGGNGKSYQTLYDYFAALQTETALSATGELIWEWCRDQQSQVLYLTGAGFLTERSYGKGIIITIASAGSVSHFTDDAGGTFVPPATVTVKMTCITNIAGSPTPVEGVTVFLETSTGGPAAVGVGIINGFTDAFGVISVSYVFVGNQAVRGRRAKGTSVPTFVAEDITGLTITSGGLDATLTLISDD